MARDLRTVNKCLVCRSYAENSLSSNELDIYQVRCCRCGVFKITGSFSSTLSAIRKTDLTPDQIANFSSYIRENQGQLFSEDDREFVRRIRTPSVAEKATKLLWSVAKEHPYAGQQFSIPVDAAHTLLKMVDEHEEESFASEDQSTIDACREIFPYIAASWSRNAFEFMFLVDNNLINRRFLEQMDNRRRLRITPEGWSYLETLEKPSDESNSAFVAMWFDPKTDPLWKEAIRPGVYSAGFEPVRIDAVEHSNKIDDEIIAHIRACKFLVADFTGQRGGV
jgi:hypothetical protein